MIDGLKPYPKYKESGVPWLGEVPEHWEVRRLKYLLRERDDCSTDGAEQLLRVSQYTAITPRKRTDGGEKPDTRAVSLVGYKRVQSNDLVVNIMLAWNGSMGVSAFSGIVSPAYCVYRFFDGNQPWFFHYLLRSTAYKAIIKAVSTGVVESRLRLYTDDLYRLKALLPPFPEQTAIVRFLDWADRRIRRVIQVRQRRIKLLEEYKQALIHQAVTGKIDVRTCLRQGFGRQAGKPYPKYKDSGVEWLGQVPEHWEVRKLKYLVSFTGGGTPSKAISAFWEGTIPWVSPKDMKSTVIADTVDHINEESIESSATSLISEGAMLLVVRSGILRRHIPVAINSVPVAINQDMKALRPKPNLLTTHYLYLIVKGCESLLLDEWTKKGATVESIEHEFLANSRLPLPPLPEQTNIVEFLNKQTEKIGAAISADQRVIELLKEFRTRLIADVVTGKLDVREAAARLPEEPLEDKEVMLDKEEKTVDDKVAGEAELEALSEEAEI